MSCCENIPEFKFALAEGLGDEFLPKKSFETDTGWDVCCAEPRGVELFPFEYAKIRLGFKIFTPPGWWVSLHPRSSFFIKRFMHVLIGTIDEEYSQELMLCGQYIPESKKSLKIGFGDRIGQIIPVKRFEMVVKNISNEEFDDLCRRRDAKRSGGFGSTD